MRPTRATLTPDLVLRAYRVGLFPMAHPRTGDIEWYAPDPRGVLPLDDRFHIPRSLRQAARRFLVTADRDFEKVIDGCARRRDTWISPEVRACYVELRRLGHAHSVESWQDGALAGGVYGVHIAGAFMAESTFYDRPDGGKVALVALVEHLRRRGFRLCDIQMVTPHTKRFGGIEISRDEYLKRLAEALTRPVEWGPFGV
jgi:leucyl/phenylalanyl-tRNA--protein transferase